MTMTNQKPESVALFYKEGTSDKEYRVELREVENGQWMALGFNGRRGGRLKEQKLTQAPTDFDTAHQAYKKKVLIQKKKGYTDDVSGAIYQSLPSDKTFSGFVPQLLNVVRDEDTLGARLDNSTHVGQEKHDGERRPIRATGKKIEGTNKEGVLVGLPMNLVEDILSLSVSSVLIDGEVMGERYVAFDLLEINGEDLRANDYHTRLSRLTDLLQGQTFQGVELVHTAFTPEQKRQLFNQLEAHGAEGMVFKKLDAAYTPGSPASGGPQEKYKFIEQCSLRVSAHHPTKRSVFVEGLTKKGGEPVPLGKVTIPPNQPIPDIGAIVNVSYLYLYDQGSLFQPGYQGERHDQSQPDDLSKFKLKSNAVFRPNPPPKKAKRP